MISCTYIPDLWRLYMQYFNKVLPHALKSYNKGIVYVQTFIWPLSLGGWLVFMATVPLIIILPHILLLLVFVSFHSTGKGRLVAVVLNWWGLMSISGLKLFRSGSWSQRLVVRINGSWGSWWMLFPPFRHGFPWHCIRWIVMTGQSGDVGRLWRVLRVSMWVVGRLWFGFNWSWWHFLWMFLVLWNL